MSVIMMLRAKADPNKVEQGAQANPDAIRAIMEKSKTLRGDRPPVSTDPTTVT